MNSTHDMTYKDLYEREKRYNSEKTETIKSLKGTIEEYEELIFEKLKPHIGEDEMLIPFIKACERVQYDRYDE